MLKFGMIHDYPVGFNPRNSVFLRDFTERGFNAAPADVAYPSWTVITESIGASGSIEPLNPNGIIK